MNRTQKRAKIQCEWAQHHIKKATENFTRKEWKELRDSTGIDYYQQEMVEKGRVHDIRLHQVLLIASYLQIPMTKLIPAKPKTGPHRMQNKLMDIL